MKLKDKVQHALDETRMLILGMQVLLGFDLQGFFLGSFGSLSPLAHDLKLANLAVLSMAIVLLFAPVARHRIVDRGHDTPGLAHATRMLAAAALLPIAVSLGIGFFIVLSRPLGQPLAIAGATLTTLVALLAWYVLPLAARGRKSSDEKDEMEPPKLNDRIRHVLTEARVVLPGTQALLGFQFAAVLQEGFEHLSPTAKTVHLIGLGFLASSVVLLMLPAAYHRIAERGEISERLHRFASACLLLSMGCLSLGLGSALFVVVERATQSHVTGLASAGAWLAVSNGTWFAAMLVLRRSRREDGSRVASAGGDA